MTAMTIVALFAIKGVLVLSAWHVFNRRKQESTALELAAERGYAGAEVTSRAFRGGGSWEFRMEARRRKDGRLVKLLVIPARKTGEATILVESVA